MSHFQMNMQRAFSYTHQQHIFLFLLRFNGHLESRF
ncbi:hypothetical protein SLEP1_g15641 [Rubroshorea leprosula]|uniref:Uncharacterized protein n=1 Tax=Rubroshorea leprosula TaxID=152421 RepID=A0AAV5IWY3_9ROSI|nr:hypothetical protein SLEP1_g15641 [Rubroshorea leprosula]